LKSEPSSSSESAENRQRFGELAAENHARVRNYLRSIGVSSSSIDDIAQEALVIAYHRFDNYEADTSFSAWVNTIARNLIWNDRRKNKRRFKLLNETVTESIVEQNPFEGMAEQEDADLQRTALRQCMDKLSENNRDLLESRYQQEMEPSQIAEQLDIPAGTLRKHLMRIRLALRKCINKYLGDDSL
jgi:RNA polymerase sigma-70 factor (ECF subfamily)